MRLGEGSLQKSLFFEGLKQEAVVARRREHPRIPPSKDFDHLLCAASVLNLNPKRPLSLNLRNIP